MYEVKTREMMCKFVNEHSFAVLSTINDQGHPHGTALYAGSDDHFNIYFMTKSGTAKSKFVDNDDLVALTFGDEVEQATLQLSGSAAEVYDGKEVRAAIEILDSLKHKSTEARKPISKLNAGSYIIFRVIPDWAHLAMYAGGGMAGGVETYDYKRL
ncbi:MAG: pyridoxamine 5'-phosphate oxidase family protein [Candidatus Saccharimonadales bacterium]